MSVTKTYFTRAIAVYQSDFCDIPYPQEAASGTSTAVVANRLVDSTKNFNTLQIAAGDIVYNHTTKKGATVVNVDPTNPNRVVLNADIFLAAGDSYTIYANSSITSLGNQGCCFVAQGGTSAVGRFMTIGGDIVDVRTASGVFYQLQVKKLFETGSGLNPIIALW